MQTLTCCCFLRVVSRFCHYYRRCYCRWLKGEQNRRNTENKGVLYETSGTYLGNTSQQ